MLDFEVSGKVTGMHVAMRIFSKFGTSLLLFDIMVQTNGGDKSASGHYGMILIKNSVLWLRPTKTFSLWWASHGKTNEKKLQYR
jgi:hypothetical protein